MKHENKLSGEMNIYEYLHIQTDSLSIVFLFAIFLHCFYYSAKTVISRPDKLAHWCCLTTTLSGIAITGGTLVPFYFPSGPSCKTVAYCLTFGFTIATLCVNAFLLERVYLAYKCDRLILVIGIILLMLPAPTFLLVFGQTVSFTIFPSFGCSIIYPPMLVYIRSIADIPINLVFIIAFGVLIRRRYCRYGKGCWTKIFSNSIRTSILAILLNVFCIAFNIIYLFSQFSLVISTIYWAATTALLVKSTFQLKNTSNSAYHYNSQKSPNKLASVQLSKASIER
ncbi:hypothetical protein BDF19DRAFT_443125 [Syncephalis fuscata]|nr:hypothetical protein BDF19DRAFT_443125 [Syncephalis fuscata]